MQATFRFRDEEVEVLGAGDAVVVFHRKGIKYPEGAHEKGERYVETENQLILSKSGARSVASAIMGAAAEL